MISDDTVASPVLEDEIVQWQPGHSHALSAGEGTGRLAVGAALVGAVAVGAFAVGALAIGTLAIGRMAVGRLRLRDVEIDNLVVRRSTLPR